MTHEDLLLKRLHELYSDQQLADIYFTPVVVSRIAIHYASLAADYAATNRMPFKLAVRRIRELIQEYDILQRTLLNPSKYDNLCSQVEDLIVANSRHFGIFYWTVNGEWKKHHPEDDHDAIRTYAIMSQAFVQVGELHVKRINEWAKLDGHGLSRMSPIIKAIGNILDSFLAGKTIEATDNINMALKIIDNVLCQSTFKR